MSRAPITYLTNPELPIIRPDWPGNPWQNGRFRYPDRIWTPEWSVIWRMLTTPNPQRKAKRQDNWLPAVAPGTDYLADKTTNWLVWLGHASFLLQLGGIRLIIDPVLTDLPFLRRQVEPPFAIADVQDIDYILLSHDHRDHCDEKTLKTLLAHNRPRKILAPLKLDRTIGQWIGTTPLEMAGWYQTYQTEATPLTIHYLPARHWCRRGLTDTNRSLWGSFLIEYGDHRIYFGGDSGYGNHFTAIGQLFPGIDIAMLGIGAYSPTFMMQESHSNPLEAGRAWRDLGARRLLPMHYGTYDLSNEPFSEPLRLLREWAARNDAGDALLVPAVNEVISLTYSRS